MYDKIGQWKTTDLHDALITADVIVVKSTRSHRKFRIWDRNIDEIVARGRPYELNVVIVPCTTKQELRDIRKYVEQLKNGE